MTRESVARKPRPSGRGQARPDLSAISAALLATTESPGEIPRSGHRPAAGKVIGEAAETQDTCGTRKGQGRSARTQTPPGYGGAVISTKTAGYRHAGIHRLQAGEDVKNPDCRHRQAGSQDGSVRMRAARRRIVLAAAALGAVVLGAGLSACSTKTSQPSSPASSSPALSSTTVMVGGNKHTMITGVDCTSSPAQPSATPAESGDLTIRIKAHDDSASVSLALSDETPPSVDGFAISLKVGTGQYQMPYQPVQSPTQVQATKEGKSYTVTGTGQATTPGQSGTRQVTFGIHVTCP